MWCSHCKQEVAAARDAADAPSCSRCRRPLVLPERRQTLTQVSDCGVLLDAFDGAAESRQAVGRPVLTDGAEAAKLRRLQRRLRTSLRIDAGLAPAPWSVGPARGLAGCDVAEERFAEPVVLRSSLPGQRRQSAWGVSLLLTAGGAGVLIGFSLLVVANMMLHAAAWRWGFAITTGGEALIVAGLSGMALRLWRNSRRLNLQLEGLDRRLQAVQSTLVQPAASRLRGPANALADAGSARG